MSQLFYPPILVIGAGELGMAIIKALRNHPAVYNVSVLLPPSTIGQDGPVSGNATISALQSMAVNIVPGDFVTESEESLVRTLSNFHTVVGCSGFTDGAAGPQMKVTRVVLDAGVPRYLPWEFGADYDVLGQGPLQEIVEEQVQVRALLRNQKTTSWIIVSTGILMSTLTDSEKFGVDNYRKQKCRALGSWDTQVTTTDVDDIGSITAAIMMNRPEVKNEVCLVAGDTLSYGEIADAFAQVWRHSKYAKEIWSREYLQNRLAANPRNQLRKQRCIYASDTGIAWSKADSWNGRKGLQTKTLREYLQQKLQHQLVLLEKQCRCRMAMVRGQTSQ